MGAAIFVRNWFVYTGTDDVRPHIHDRGCSKITNPQNIQMMDKTKAVWASP